MNDFVRGLFRENPVFVVVIGVCPALAITDRVVNALGMGAAVIIVLVFSNIFAAAFRGRLPERARLPVYTLVIAVAVTVVDLLMEAYTPQLYKALGVYAKLIVVNCLILGRAEAFAERNPVGRSVVDALGMGFGFALSLVVIAFVREVFGAGTITLFPVGTFSGTLSIPVLSRSPIRVFGLASGAFLVFGYLKALVNWYRLRDARAAADRGDGAGRMANDAGPASTR